MRAYIERHNHDAPGQHEKAHNKMPPNETASARNKDGVICFPCGAGPRMRPNVWHTPTCQA